MGTRADFYIGRGKTAQWIGSIAWDGYPGGITPQNTKWCSGRHLFDATSEKAFRRRVADFFKDRDDVTLPEQGWPWPWENSNTTDYAYAFDEGKVYGTCFGHGWWVAKEGEPEEDERAPKNIDWPDMRTDGRAPLGSKRSGVMVLTALNLHQSLNVT